MPVKSVIDIEVNDAALNKAVDTFKKLQQTIGKTPGLGGGGPGGGGAVPGGGGGGGGRPGGGGGGILGTPTQNVIILLNQAEKKQGDLNKKTKEFATYSKYASASWKSIKDDTSAIGNSLRTMSGHAMNLIRRAGIAGGISGVLGVGGSLWGLEHLAASASAGRRSSQGLGLTYGQQQAFAVTYGRLLDPGAFLGGVGQGRGNLAGPQAGALYALGLNPAGPGNTGQHASDALSRIRQLTLNTPEHLLGTLLQTHRLGDLGLGVEDLRRIRSLSPQDFEKYQQDYRKRSDQFGVTDDRMKAWQDLNVMLSAAGQKIKSTLIDGLAPLAKPIEQLSEGFSDLVKSLLGSQGFKDLMKSATEGLKDFATYVASPKFKDDVLFLVHSVADLAHGFARLLGIVTGNSPSAPRNAATMTFEEYKKLVYASPKWAGSDPSDPRNEAAIRAKYMEIMKDAGKNPADIFGGGGGGKFGSMLNSFGGPVGIGATPVNNPGNMRPVGASTGFQQFPSPQAGLTAMANNLLYYQDKKGLDTLRKIVSTWSPGNENDTARLIKEASNTSQFGPDQKLNLHDTDTLARVMRGIIGYEGNGNNPNYQKPVIIEVLNNTGGNAIVRSSQMGFPQ